MNRERAIYSATLRCATIVAFVCFVVVLSVSQERKEGRRPRPADGGQKYSIEQAISDQAQLHTIAFNGLAFLTGDFGAATFIPPGKVCDYFGFQYMRDIDASQKGHNPMFLNRVSGNVLKMLSDEQRRRFAELAQEQAPQFISLAKMRLPLIKAFYRQSSGEIPAGTDGLSKEAVKKYVGEMFAYDAELSYRRAEVFGTIVQSFLPDQRAALSQMKFGDFRSWPDVDVAPYKMPRGTVKMVNVAYMTYASEFFSWYAGSIDADVYFCPERHGTYFGGFYMKDMPAMGKKDFDISTSITGDSGKEFLETLTGEQRKAVVDVIALQRAALKEIIVTRRAISEELRKFLVGGRPDKAKVIALGRRYGELDGELSYYYATAFAQVNRSLKNEQRSKLMKLRNLDGYTSAPAYLYSDPMTDKVEVGNTDQFFHGSSEAK